MILNPLTDINIFVKHLWSSSISLNWRAPLHVENKLYGVLVLFYQNTMELRSSLSWNENELDLKKTSVTQEEWGPLLEEG